MTTKTILKTAAALALCLGAGEAAGAGSHFSATPGSANIAQPHLDAARALAEQDNSPRHVALVTCYP